jgi:hypothetical protein
LPSPTEWREEKMGWDSCSWDAIFTCVERREHPFFLGPFMFSGILERVFFLLLLNCIFFFFYVLHSIFKEEKILFPKMPAAAQTAAAQTSSVCLVVSQQRTSHKIFTIILGVYKQRHAKISFKFLFITTCPQKKQIIDSSTELQSKNQIRYLILKGASFDKKVLKRNIVHHCLCTKDDEDLII